jgi:hypothetical protein
MTTKALLITLIAIVIGYVWVGLCTYYETRNLKRRMNAGPKAEKNSKKKETLDYLLDLDDSEKFYHQN